MKKLILTFLLLTSPAYAADIAIYNEGTNAVLQYRKSANTGNYIGRTDIVINPDISALAGVPLKYWKHSAGSIVEMTAGEKTAVDNAEAAALLAQQQARADALAFSQEDVLTSLVKVINIRIPGNPITKQELIDQLKTDLGL